MLLKLTLMEEGGKKIKCRLLLSLLIPQKKLSVGFILQGKQLIRREMSSDTVGFHLTKVKGQFIIS